MSDEHSRRGTDPLIVEMHGMMVSMNGQISSLVQRMDDHIKVDEKEHSKILDLQTRIVPVENFRHTMKAAGRSAKRIAMALATPALVGVGAYFWAWVRMIVSQGGNHQ